MKVASCDLQVASGTAHIIGYPPKTAVRNDEFSLLNECQSQRCKRERNYRLSARNIPGLYFDF